MTKLSESQVLEAKRRINNGEISTRAMAKELSTHHSTLDERIKKLNGQSILSKPDTKPDNNKKTRQLIIKPDTKPDIKEIHLSISLLRGLHELIIGKSEQHKNSRDQLLDIFINEFQRQKESIR